MGRARIKPNLSVNLGGGLRLSNPVLTASGTFGYGIEFAPFMKLNAIGGILTKGLSLLPREGNPAPRIVETPSGMLNSIGLANVGVDAFINEKLPKLKKYKTKVIANIFGETISEYTKVARKLESEKGVHALEVNISCPNVKKGGIGFGTDPREAAKVVRAVRKVTKKHMMVKLSPNVTDIKLMAKAVERAGADSISLINTIPGMVVDVNKRRPMLAMKMGGLSGPAIKPIAVRMVYEVSKVVSVPIIGIGGIMTARDALEFIIAGASAVQVGTANFVTPDASVKVVRGIEDYLMEEKIGSIKKLTGSIID